MHPGSVSTTAPPTKSSWARGAGSPATRSCAGSRPRPRLRWVDVGCGNGAFTEMLVDRCAPLAVQGIDPSPEQIEFARARIAGGRRAVRRRRRDGAAVRRRRVRCRRHGAGHLLRSRPGEGVAEMARVVRPGGSVSAYAWDILGGGFPFAALQDEMAALGVDAALAAERRGVAASRRSRALWADAGLVEIETREIDGRADLQRLRFVLADRPDGPAPRRRAWLRCRPAIGDAQRAPARPAGAPTRTAASRTARARTRSRGGFRR